MSDPRNPRSHEDNDRGRRGEDYVRRRDDLEPCPKNDWCDLVNPRNGTKHEVKVCLPDKRFRIWEDNHRSLVRSDAAGTAWYHFLVVTSSGNVVSERQVKPSTVTRWVRERGGWNRSGHVRGDHGGEDGQHKLPEGDVF